MRVGRSHIAVRSAYIHVPFCRHRCGYCNFTLVAGRDDLIEAYLDAIDREAAWLGGPHEVDTLFLGGGTPSHLKGGQLQRLLTIVTRAFPLAAGHEFSMEVNPADVTDDLVDAALRFGVNRISLGVQSFHDDKLETLERDHRRGEIDAAVARCHQAFESVSLDLIFGTHGETLGDWTDDLSRALAVRPNHLSTYGLTYEKGTTFWSRRERDELQPVADDVERQMYEAGIDRLSGAGFDHYEVSNFALPGHRCRHNEVYWTGGEYFALGPGAARHIDGRREINHRSTTTYLKRVLAGESPVFESEALSREDSARERLVFGLRRLEGVASNAFEQQTGFSIDDLAAREVERLVAQGLLEQVDGYLRLTRDGLLLSDSIWPLLLRA